MVATINESQHFIFVFIKLMVTQCANYVALLLFKVAAFMK